MFYYYEKAGKLLASERRDLPYLKAEPAPGTPICYLVEGDPVLGRGSFKVNCPGQLRAPHGLEVLDASRLPDFPLDAPLSAALEDLLSAEGNQHRSALSGQGTQGMDLPQAVRENGVQPILLLPAQDAHLAEMLPRCGEQRFGVAVQLLLGVG